ncbi:DUF262 domain-containing protein [Bacillus sp. 196mf]|uniref:DUF262 domain-containing protein n=1 Tax=Bacillus sp. 196mf TaxID=1761754 RepID=UPI000D7C8CA0|nr:DUF262 domain-containing protein [Bacillus sp. 196mf]PYE91341.1 uncharacterized protein DUF262 [Bacillus sp. 196mf]
MQKYGIKSHTELKNFTVMQIVDGINEKESKNKAIIKVRLPKLQRNLVWSETQKRKFIDTLKQGFPFGSLLFYKKEDEDTALLVDGLQRTSTMLDCVKHPLKYFDQNEIDSIYIDAFIKTYPILNKDLLKREIESWMKTREGFNNQNNYTGYYLAEEIEEKFQVTASSKKDGRELISKLDLMLDEIKSTSDISNINIPVVIYHGEESNLPEIFERINSRGTKLNKYQIFAATWERTFTVDNREILEMIALRYKAWEKEGFVIDNYDETTFKQESADITLFEYLFGLGKFLQQQYPILFGDYNEDKADEVDSKVFNLVTACCLLDIQKMNNLEDVLSSQNLNHFEKALLSSVKFANDLLYPILSFRPYKKKKQKEKIFHSDFHLVTLISTIFHLKYNNSLQERPLWSEYKKRLSKSIPAHYLYDILLNFWRGTGDKHLRTFVLEPVRNNELESLHYINLPKKKQWENVLQLWFDEQLSKKEKKRVSIDDRTILFIKYLYHNVVSFSAAHQDHHIDHIFPINRLKDAAEHIGGLPMSCVSNLTLLPKEVNLEKTKKTFPEYYATLSISGKDTPIINEICMSVDKCLFDNSKEYNIPVSANKDNIKKEWFEQILSKRFSKITEQLYKNNILYQ